jgi:long-chain fatty acid transport protein
VIDRQVPPAPRVNVIAGGDLLKEPNVMSAARRTLVLCALSLLAVAQSAPVAQGQAFFLAGAGPVNRSMGGASTAAPLDATGSLYWNPATIAGLPSSELDFALELLYPRSTVSSAVPANALGPGLPAGPMAGTTHDEAGVYPIPTGGFVYRPEGSPLTIGLGVFATGGFGTNYPGSVTNPIFSPFPPNGVGIGPVESEFLLLQVAPTVTYQITDALSVGLAPEVGMASFSLDPGVFFPPGAPVGGVVAPASAITHTRYAWGAGFQLGLYYVANESWKLGAAFKSPEWFEDFRYQARDQLGRPITLKLPFEPPLIVSVGAAYTGFERFTIAADLRYVDFKESPIVGTAAGFDAAGAVRGLGWDNVFALALGVQYQFTDSLAVRVGYTFNTNPISNADATFNIASPLVYQHELAAGASYQLTPACSVSVGYYHIFANSVTGPFVTPAGPIPGSSVTAGSESDSLSVGFGVRF